MAGRNPRAVRAQERDFTRKDKERLFPLRVVPGEHDDDEMAKPKSRSRNTAAPTTQVVSLAEEKCLVPICKVTFIFPWGAFFVPGKVRAGVCSAECNEAYRKIISVIECKIPETVPVEEKP